MGSLPTDDGGPLGLPPGSGADLPGAIATATNTDPVRDGIPFSVFKTLVNQYEGGNKYSLGWGSTDLSQAPLGPDGFPQWDGKPGPTKADGTPGPISHAAGGWQIEPDTWAPYAKQLGITDFSPPSQDKVAKALFLDQGTKPWVPYNPTLAAAVAQYKKNGNMDTSVGVSPLDPTQYYLDPATQRYISIDGTQPDFPANIAGLPGMGLPPPPDASAPGNLDTSNLPALGTGRQLAGLTPPTVTDASPQTSTALQTALASAKNGPGFNVSKMLMQMAGGLLSHNESLGHGLGAGFTGAASSLNSDQDMQMRLQQMQAIYGNAAQRNMDMLVRAGVPISIAAKTSGVQLDPAAATAADQAQAQGKPMAPGASKLEDTNLAAIGDQRKNQIQLKTIRDQLANNEFSLDPLSRLAYKAELAIGMPSDSALKFQAMNATVENMRQDLQNQAKGATSDQRANNALSALTGGGGFTSSAQAIRHLDYLGNTSALAENNLRNRIDMNRTRSKYPAFNWDDYNQGLPASPYKGLSPDTVAGNLYGNNAAPVPQTGSPDTGNTGIAGQPTIGTTKSGVQYKIIGQ